MDPFQGEIRIFGGSFAPSNWALCNGQLLPISQNRNLYNILQTAFGGNGTTTFALPDMRDNIPLGQGQGPGLSSYKVGQTVGTVLVPITSNEAPAHTHPFMADFDPGEVKVPANNTSVARISPGNMYAPDTGTTFTPMADTCISGFTGGTTPHANVQPFVGVVFIIALQGMTPAR